MTREMCYRCFLPQHLCWCGTAIPMPTRTRFVILMHPKEFKHEKAGTGRLTHLCLADSEIRMGVCFDEHQAVQALIHDPLNLPVLLYPGEAALNVSQGELGPEELGGRRLVVFLLDATWSCAREMLKLSPTLQALPRIMFSATAPSRFVIKQQPQAGCLSTLEATHELLLALAKAGLDEYPRPEQMLGLFERMQQFHLDCARDPSRDGYRRSGGYSDPASRRRPKGASGLRRNRFLRAPAETVPAQPPAAPPKSGSES